MPRTIPATTQSHNNSNGVESAPSHQRVKIENASPEDTENTGSSKRLKDIEICVPIVYGTISFWLGKKASESQSYKWTVYVRGPRNEDLSAVIKRVVFHLHPSFKNPVRVVESPPFELTECGWGEFEIAITILLHGCDEHMYLYHFLKLYPDDESVPMSTKKPTVSESYDEIVFPNPPKDFFSRVLDHPAVLFSGLPDTFNSLPALLQDEHNWKESDKEKHKLGQWFTKFSEADELLKLAAARQQVQAHIVKLRSELGIVDGLP